MIYDVNADGKTYFVMARSKAAALDYFRRCCPWPQMVAANRIVDKPRLEYIKNYCYVWRAEDG